MKSLAKDLGLDLSLVAHTDATAAIGICRRCGLGKVRHLAIADLWIQDRVRSKDFALGFAELIKNNRDYLIKDENFVVLSDNYKIIQVHKNLESYKAQF